MYLNFSSSIDTEMVLVSKSFLKTRTWDMIQYKHVLPVRAIP